jgi:hypothetical protein
MAKSEDSKVILRHRRRKYSEMCADCFCKTYVQTGFGVQSSSYQMSSGSTITGGKAASAEKGLVLRLGLYLHCAIRLDGMVFRRGSL